MQIFFVDRDPIIAAQSLCDKHIVKMPIEAAQLLSITSVLCGGIAPYKSGKWKNHPCAIWVRQSKQHTDWLLVHGKELCNEFYKRYRPNGGKHHASLDALLSLETHGTFPVDNGWKDPPQALPEDVQHEDVITAYRQYYNKYKTKFATWKEPANPPEWFVQYVRND
jgi:hypothetical protein